MLDGKPLTKAKVPPAQERQRSAMVSLPRSVVERCASVAFGCARSDLWTELQRALRA